MEYHNKASCPFIYEHKIPKNNGEFNFYTIIHKNRTKNTKHMRKSANKIKVAKKLLQSCQTAMDVLYSNMPHNDGNVEKKKNS